MIMIMSDKRMKKGFTLVELLVVIAILAVLTAAVVVVLNPGELLKQSRDAQRLADFDSVRSAINLYLSLTTSTTPFGAVNVADAMASSGAPACFYVNNGATCGISSTLGIDTTGWIPVNFKDGTFVNMSPPLSNLPVDPSNTATYHYAIGTDATNKYYNLKSVLESSKYNSRMANDGGSGTAIYEVGNAPGLNL